MPRPAGEGCSAIQLINLSRSLRRTTANGDGWRGRWAVRNLPMMHALRRWPRARPMKRSWIELILGWTGSRRAAEVADILQGAGVAAAVAADNRYLDEEDPHLNQRDYFVELKHPEVGVKKHCGIPWKMSRTECAVRAPAPCIGQHTDEDTGAIAGLLSRMRSIGCARRAHSNSVGSDVAKLEYLIPGLTEGGGIMAT